MGQQIVEDQDINLISTTDFRRSIIFKTERVDRDQYVIQADGFGSEEEEQL